MEFSLNPISLTETKNAQSFGAAGIDHNSVVCGLSFRACIFVDESEYWQIVHENY